MVATRRSSSTAPVPTLSTTATTLTTATPRPRSGAQSASSSSSARARPFSSTNLSATGASSRFKTFAVQYEILRKNAILTTIATEVAWKNLLDLFTLKFYAVGDVLWRQGDHPSELSFVLCGGFLVRHMAPPPEQEDAVPDPHHRQSNNNAAKPGSGPEQELPSTVIVAEKLVKPGASIALYAVDHTTSIKYTVVTAKFKSILISLPVGKYKSVLRQLTPQTKTHLQQLIVDQEAKLCGSIKLPAPRAAAAVAPRATTAPLPVGGHAIRSSTSLTLKKSASTTSTVASTSSLSNTDPAVTALSDRMAHTASWDSLHVSKPAEYEVDSSLLILHESSTGSQQQLRHGRGFSSCSSSSSASACSSSSVRAIAKKHTTRRLQSIKLPTAVDAFPPVPKHKQLEDFEAQALAIAISTAGGHSLDVVPKIRIGRLLAPIKKPAIVEKDEEEEKANDQYHQRAVTRGEEGGRGGIRRSSSQNSLVGRHILLADRVENFREVLF